MKAVLEKELKLQRVGFVKQVSFKPGMKEREREQSGESKKKVMGEGICESEIEELGPE